MPQSLDNNLKFKFYNGSIYSNFKNNRVIKIIVIIKCVMMFRVVTIQMQLIQHMWVWRLFNKSYKKFEFKTQYNYKYILYGIL